MKLAILDWYANENVPTADADLGRIRLLFNPNSPDPAWQQLQDTFGDDWQPYRSGWNLFADHRLGRKGERPMAPSAMAWLRDEAILVYRGGWVCIVQENGDFTVGRIEP